MPPPKMSVFRREPSLGEVADAMKEIKSHEAIISNLQHQINSLQVQIHRLRGQQNEHVNAISYHRGVITLSRRIPSELLAKIFKHCVEDGWTRAPIIVSHVCSQWRTAARAYPRVWSHIYVNADSNDVIGRTRFWLNMALKAPLHIIVVATWRASPSQLEDAMDILLSHADQWRNFTVQSNMLRHTQYIISRCMGATTTFRELRAIDIEAETQFDPDMDMMEGNVIQVADVFSQESAPNLHSLRLHCNVLPPMNFPAHLRSLVLEVGESVGNRPLSSSTLLAVLESLPSLTALSVSLPLHYEELYQDDRNPENPVIFSSLTNLTLYGPADLNGLLAHLCAPSLRELHLRFLEDLRYRQDSIGPTLLHFIQTSAASEHPLEILELHDIDLSPEYFASCFSSLPNLCELRLHESSISSETLRLLNGGFAGLCPKLTKLNLRWCGHLTGRALVDLVRSRKVALEAPTTQIGMDEEDVGRAIAEIAVINCCFVGEQDILELAKLTVCRVVAKEGDYCHSRECCGNLRYRQRLRLRHIAELSPEQRSNLRLIV